MVNINLSVKDLQENELEKYKMVQIKRPDGVIEILLIPKEKETTIQGKKLAKKQMGVQMELNKKATTTMPPNS